MRFYWLALGTLGVWRVTHFLAAEDGPGDIVVRVRKKLGSGFWGKLLDCFYCMSLWVAVPVAVYLGQSAAERILLWLALSGGAILLQRIGVRETVPPIYYENGGHPDVVLREGESGVERDGSESGE